MVDEQIADAVALAIQLEENGQIKARVSYAVFFLSFNDTFSSLGSLLFIYCYK